MEKMICCEVYHQIEDDWRQDDCSIVEFSPTFQPRDVDEESQAPKSKPYMMYNLQSFRHRESRKKLR